MQEENGAGPSGQSTASGVRSGPEWRTRVDMQLRSAPQCPSLGGHQVHPGPLVLPRTPKQETTSTPSPLPFPSSSQHRVLYCSLPIPKNPQSGSDSVSSHLCISHQSCLTLCDILDSSPQGSSVHGIFQARILEWVVIKGTQTPSLSASPSPPGHWKLQ